MTEFFQSAVGWLTPLFVVTSMANVGLTQDPRRILRYLGDWEYLVRMVLTSFLVVPALMFFSVHVVGVEGPYSFGLLVFASAAGAPLLIKLTERSSNDVAAGATVQMVLMAATILVLPLLLPRIIEGVSVDAGAITRSLLLQLFLPLAVGMVLLAVAEGLVAVVQPWIARISNIALYAMLAATLLGYLPQLADGELWGAILVGIVVLLIAFYVGYGTGHTNRTKSQIGALGTAQRNTAAAMIVAQGNFEDPLVLVTVAILNTVMMIVLLTLATRISNDTKIALLEPLEADTPVRRPSPWD